MGCSCLIQSRELGLLVRKRTSDKAVGDIICRFELPYFSALFCERRDVTPPQITTPDRGLIHCRGGHLFFFCRCCCPCFHQRRLRPPVAVSILSSGPIAQGLAMCVSLPTHLRSILRLCIERRDIPPHSSTDLPSPGCF